MNMQIITRALRKAQNPAPKPCHLSPETEQMLNDWRELTRWRKRHLRQAQVPDIEPVEMQDVREVASLEDV